MQDMISFLQDEYLERCRKNEQYSLRAFARSLSIPASTLSEIINKKRPLTAKLRNKIGESLGIPPEMIHKFSAQEHGNKRYPGPIEEKNYHQLAIDSFYIISDWFHYGILQLMKTKDFQNDLGWIAKRLGIKPLQVKLAIQRLKRVGILEEHGQKLIDMTNGNTSHLQANFSNEDLRNFQKRALENALVAMDKYPVTQRDNTSMTLAISKEAIPFAKKEITAFRRSLTKKLESYANPDEVYQLAISLTPLTVIESK